MIVKFSNCIMWLICTHRETAPGVQHSQSSKGKECCCLFFKKNKTKLLLNCYDCLPTRSKEWLILFFYFLFFFKVKQQNPYIPNISVTWEEMCNYTIWCTASTTRKTWRTLLGYSNLKLVNVISTHQVSSFSTRMIKLLVQNYGNLDPKMSPFSHADNILLEEQDVSLCYVLTSR